MTDGSAFRWGAMRRDDVGRVYAIGDIHGRFDLFEQLVEQIAEDQAARPPVPTVLILLGDIIDRGPESARLVHGCMKLTMDSDRFVVLKGNHEAMMAQALQGDLIVLEAWLRNGGTETLVSWGMDRAFVEGGDDLELCAAARSVVGKDVLDWLARLPLTYRFEDHLFVHAGIRPGCKLSRQVEEDLLWITEDFLTSNADHGVTVVHGHSVCLGGPEVRKNRIGIDTGAVFTGQLTALGIEKGESWTLMTGDALTRPDDVHRIAARRVLAAAQETVVEAPVAPRAYTNAGAGR